MSESSTRTPTLPTLLLDSDGWPDPFPLRRYRLELRVERTLAPMALAAPTLRSVLGRALREMVCVTLQPRCEGCGLRSGCAYPSMFEASVPSHHPRHRGDQAPNPFVIDAPSSTRALEPGDRANVSLTLIGPALDRLDLVLEAFRRASEEGMGKRCDGQRGSATLTGVTCERLPHDPACDHDHLVLGAGERRPRAHTRAVSIPACAPSLRHVELQLRSPLRLLRNGKLIERAELRAIDLLGSLLRRQASFIEWQLGRTLQVDFGALRQLAQSVRLEQALEHRAARRYSARQHRSLPLDGHLGTLVLEGELAPFWPALFLGQYLHAGKAATSGNGAYRIISSRSGA